MRQLVYAHRGGVGLAPENTIPAFDRGLAEGADGLEFDVRLSRDGIPVVHHDPMLDRTTNASGPLAALTADELARLDAAWHFQLDGEFVARGQEIGVPRLDDVVRRYPDAPLIIEMKGDDPAVAHAIVEVLRKRSACDRAMLASFHLPPLLAARSYGPAIRTGAAPREVRSALYRSWCGLSPRRPAYQGFQLPEKTGALRIVSPRLVRLARRAGLSVAVWVINEEARMQRLLDWGITALITDRPALARSVVGRR
jgi:glycerophosphoryl diester phosphodiesterase